MQHALWRMTSVASIIDPGTLHSENNEGGECSLAVLSTASIAVVPAQAMRKRAPSRHRPADGALTLQPSSCGTGSLSLQTKCNTFLERCCDGTHVRAVVIGRPMRDCPASSRRTNDS